MLLLSILLREHVVVVGGRWSVVGGSVVVGGGGRRQDHTVLVTEYVRTRCTDVARFLTLNFWSRLFTYRAHELPMIVGTMRYSK